MCSPDSLEICLLLPPLLEWEVCVTMPVFLVFIMGPFTGVFWTLYKREPENTKSEKKEQHPHILVHRTLS